MMLMTERARRVRRHNCRNARRGVTVLKRKMHRVERRAARQLLKSGVDDLPGVVTRLLTERDVI